MKVRTTFRSPYAFHSHTVDWIVGIVVILAHKDLWGRPVF